MTRALTSLFLLTLLSLFSVGLSTAYGSVHLDLSQIVAALQHHGSALSNQILWVLRIPRTVNAFTTGGLLALSGCLMQALLRNPLADPYILGVSGGAAVLNLLALLIGITGIWLNATAFCGALLAMGLVFLCNRQLHPQRLLLTGVVLAAFWSAVISFILTVSPNRDLKGMLFWLMGRVGEQHAIGLETGVLLLGLCAAFSLAPQLNLLIRGELNAQSLGVNVKALRYQLFLLSALLTAVAVTLSGSIGFVGLMIPHILRLLKITDHRWLIPSCVLLGGSFLTCADTLARTLLAPQQLPVGILTALLGLPLMLILLRTATCRPTP